jgi:hypothetical protein
MGRDFYYNPPDGGPEKRLKNRIAELERERDEARKLAWEYRWDIRSYVSEYAWEKHWAHDQEDYPWLPEKWDDFNAS